MKVVALAKDKKPPIRWKWPEALFGVTELLRDKGARQLRSLLVSDTPSEEIVSMDSLQVTVVTLKIEVDGLERSSRMRTASSRV